MWPFIYSISFESEFFVANIAPTVYLYVYARDSHIETPRKRYAFSRAPRAPRSEASEVRPVSRATMVMSHVRPRRSGNQI